MPTQLAALLTRILVQGALALPYAARGLDNAAASAMRNLVRGADNAVTLAELGGEEREAWHDALRGIMEDPQATPLLAGAAARLLYEAEALSLERRSDPARPRAVARPRGGGCRRLFRRLLRRRRRTDDP